MSKFKGKLKITLNDAKKLEFVLDPMHFLSNAKDFKLNAITDNTLVSYVFQKPGSDWKASIDNIFLNDLFAIINVDYVSFEDYNEVATQLSYDNFVRTVLPTRLNEIILRALTDYYVRFELFT